VLNKKMPEIFEIEGGQKLSGEIKVNGAKNSALKILAASLLSDEKCKITNFPFIEDTKRIMEILESLGAKVEKNEELKEVEIDPSSVNGMSLTGDLVRKLRASILLAGPLLARFGKVEIDHPGGCVIGKRPIDFFVDGFKKLGASCEESDQSAKLVSGEDGLVGGEIIFVALIPLINCSIISLVTFFGLVLP
jgi:UDP-N-acetylglucosamine 1-carboxyvinyltransferase